MFVFNNLKVFVHFSNRA